MSAAMKYKDLLLDYVPRPIRSKTAYAHALRQIEELMGRPHVTRAESEMIELLATLIEQYESAEHPTPDAAPGEVLKHLLETHGITKAQLARATDIPRSVITNVLAGRRAISKTNAVRLAKYFGVSLSLFIDVP